ncbi:MAG: hypothetical protein QM676_07040 [Novosphingobium sp.]
MTEGDRAYYQRRLKEEMNLARAISDPESKALHLQWAKWFNDRLEGKRPKRPPPLPMHQAS